MSEKGTGSFSNNSNNRNNHHSYRKRSRSFLVKHNVNRRFYRERNYNNSSSYYNSNYNFNNNYYNRRRKRSRLFRRSYKPLKSRRRSSNSRRDDDDYQKERRRRRSRSFSSIESIIETEEELKIRWQAKFEKEKHLHPPRPEFVKSVANPRRLLEIKYWDRTPEMLEQKLKHTESLDLSKVIFFYLFKKKN